MTAQATVEGLISAATAAANTAQLKAIQYSDQAQNAAGGSSGLGTPPTISAPSVLIPPFDPSIDLTGDFLRAYNDAVADFDPDFQGEINDFITKFFPNITQCLKTAVDGWICAVLQSGGTGMQPDVENALWQRSRDRDVLDARRAEDEAVSGYAARGWALAGGVVIDAVQRVQQGLSDKVSTHSRDVAIKQADIEIENIRLAVDQGLKLRLGVISALIDYLKSWASIRELAIKKAEALIDAKIRLYQSVAAYYSAIIGAARLMLDYDKLQVDRFVSVGEIEMRGFSDHLEARVGAAISAAEAMGAIASAALGSHNTLAEVAHNTQAASES